MTDYDILMFIFIIISFSYYIITQYLIIKIDRLYKKNRLLEEENNDLRSGFCVKKF